MADDASESFDPNTCIDCGGITKPGRFRCDPCQLAVHERRRKAREALVNGYRETSHTIAL